MAPTGGRMQSVILCFSFLMVFLPCSAYRKYNIGHDKVCSHVKKQTVKLGPPENGILITEERTFDKWSGFKEFRCKFKVELQDGALFMVIQNLNFRRDPFTGECMDYIQITGNDKTKRTDKICGIVNAVRRQYGNAVQSFFEIAPIAFVDYDGEISVEVYVANEPLSSDSEELTLRLAFTQTVPCSSRNSFACAEDKCIPMKFKLDGIVNCPYESCLDEHCTLGEYEDVVGPKVPKSGLGTKVVLGAVATVLLAFVLFLVIIWVLRRCHKACWSPPHQRVPASAAESGALAEHLAYNRGSTPLARTSSSGHAQSEFPPSSVLVESGDTLPPSAPPAHLTADKDLPPSYESLFPSR